MVLVIPVFFEVVLNEQGTEESTYSSTGGNYYHADGGSVDVDIPSYEQDHYDTTTFVSNTFVYIGQYDDGTLFTYGDYTSIPDINTYVPIPASWVEVNEARTKTIFAQNGGGRNPEYVMMWVKNVRTPINYPVTWVGLDLPGVTITNEDDYTTGDAPFASEIIYPVVERSGYNYDIDYGPPRTVPGLDSGITITYTWTEISTPTYTMTWEFNGGSTTDGTYSRGTTVDYEYQIVWPDSVTKYGTEIAYVIIESDDWPMANGDVARVNYGQYFWAKGDTKVEIFWEPTPHTLTWNFNGGLISSDVVYSSNGDYMQTWPIVWPPEDSVTLIGHFVDKYVIDNAASREYYIHNPGSDYVFEMVYGQDEVVNGDTTITYNWVPEYTITWDFDGGGTSTPDTEYSTGHYGSSTVRSIPIVWPPINTVTKHGHRIDPSNVLIINADFDTYQKITYGAGWWAVGDTSIKIVWIRQCTMTWDFNGGLISLAPGDDYTSNGVYDNFSQIVWPPEDSVTQIGHVIYNYVLDNDNTKDVIAANPDQNIIWEIAYGQDEMINGDTTITYNWIRTYTLTWRFNGGTTIDREYSTGTLDEDHSIIWPNPAVSYLDHILDKIEYNGTEVNAGDSLTLTDNSIITYTWIRIYNIEYYPGYYHDADDDPDAPARVLTFTVKDKIGAYITLSTSKYIKENREHIGWSVDYTDGSFLNETTYFPNPKFTFQYSNVNVTAIWKSKEYMVVYNTSPSVDALSGTFYTSFYIPDKQIYTVDDLDQVNGLKLKNIYVEYCGFYTDGWTLGTNEDFQTKISNPSEFYDGATLRETTQLYPVWKKIDYRLINNTYNYVSIYSRKDNFSLNNDKYFYPYTKRLKYDISLYDPLDPTNTEEYIGQWGIVVPNAYKETYNAINPPQVTLNEAYSFFYEDELYEPGVKSLDSLQEIYRKKSLNELKDVVVVKHYSSIRSITTAVARTEIHGTNDYYYMFSTNGNFQIDIDMICEILIVGGGGSGGNGDSDGGGGGGGAGSVVHIPLCVLTSGTYNIIVGSGGNESNGNESKIEFLKDGSENEIIANATGGGKGGNFNTNGSDGGSGGGAGGNNSDETKLGGNEGLDSGSKRSVSYKNKAGFSSETSGSGGGGAGTYSANIKDGNNITDGGEGIYINIINDNSEYGKGGDGGEKKDSAGTDGDNGIHGTGGGGGGGDSGKNGGMGGSGIVIIRVKEGYEFDHGSDHEIGENRMMLPNILLHRQKGIYKYGLNLPEGPQINETLRYYGYLKAPSDNEYLFNINANILLNAKFEIGFDRFNDTKLKLGLIQTGLIQTGLIQTGYIHLKKDVYYPIYAEYKTSAGVSDNFKIEIKIKDSVDAVQPIPSSYLFHLNNFPGTTSMSI